MLRFGPTGLRLINIGMSVYGQTEISSQNNLIFDLLWNLMDV